MNKNLLRKITVTIMLSLAEGAIMAFMGLNITYSLVISINKSLSSEYAMRYLLMENIMGDYIEMDKRNILIFFPTFLYLFGGVIIMNFGYLNNDKKNMQLELLRCGSCSKMCSLKVKNSYISLFFYELGYMFMVGQSAINIVSIVYVFICAAVRVVFLFQVMYYTYYLYRKYNGSIALVGAIIYLMISIIIDSMIEEFSIVSYGVKYRPYIWGMVLNTFGLLVWRYKARARITYTQIV